jgi:anti-sigma-K factor RskA
MSNASDQPDGSEGSRSLDAQQGNWLTRNFWMLKGLIAALALVAFGVIILFSFEGAMANVVWAMSVTLAALVVLFQIGIAVVQSTREV